MKAAVLRECPGRLDVAEIETDGPRADEVLVRTAAAGLCHSDLHTLDGTLPLPPPVVMGHEAAGIVEEVGDRVSSVRRGDPVVTCLSRYCGLCEFCVSGRSYLCCSRATRRASGEPPRLSENGTPVGQASQLGSFAEQMLVHESAVVGIPSEMPLDCAALLGCAALTGLGAVIRTAAIRPGARVAVIGCGGVGLHMVQGSRIAGASQIIAVDIHADRRDLAAALGATDTVDGSQENTEEAILELTSGGVDYSFEAVGSASTVELAFKVLRPGGTTVVTGLFGLDESISVPAMHLLRDRRLQGCVMGSHQFRLDIPTYAGWYLDGRLELDAIIARRLRLEEIDEGFRELQDGRVLGRNLIVFEEVAAT